MDRIILNNVSKKFKIGSVESQTALSKFLLLFSGQEPKKTIWANQNISLTVPAGKIIGIIGPNGSGKSTLFRIIAGIYQPDEGEVIVNGKIISLINLYVGMKERLTMRENIYLYCTLFGLSRKETKEKFNGIVNFSELKGYTNTKLYQFSTGMIMRLAFSVAIYCNPDILLLDEVFEIGDQAFKASSANKIKELAHQGTAVILVSQELQLIEKYCQLVISMEQGKIVKTEKIRASN